MPSALFKNIKIIILLLILTSIPVVTLMSQQMSPFQSDASGWNFWGKKSKNTFPLIGYVYEDKNKNQIRDKDEQGVEGVGIEIGTESKKDSDRSKNKRAEYPLIYTDSFGFFKYDLPRNVVRNSITRTIILKLPEGYALTTTPQFQRTVRRKAQKIMQIGIAQEEIQPPDPPVPEPSTEPSPTESMLPETPTPTPNPTLTSTPIPTVQPPICPEPPLCEDELIILNQENGMMCPIYVCYSTSPAE